MPVDGCTDIKGEVALHIAAVTILDNLVDLQFLIRSALGEILDKYHEVSEAHEKLKTEMRQLQIEFYTVKQQYETSQEKLKFFTSQSSVEFGELEEALAILKSRKGGGQQSDHPDFVTKTDEEVGVFSILMLLMFSAVAN